MLRRTLLGSLVLPGSRRLIAAAGLHPRLFLSATRVTELKGRISGSHRAIWEIVKENADAHLGRLPSPRFENESDMRTAGRGVPWQALAFLLTGEPRYLDGARAWMARICSFPRWENDKSLAAGECLFGVAVGYDWLHDRLAAEERKRIREKLVQQAETLRQGPPVHHDVWLANHNHVEHLGLAAAGFALESEVPEARAWVRQAHEVFQTALRFSSHDGSSTEGHQYWAYSVESILRYAELARDLLHENLYSSEWLKSVPDFIIHSTLPDFSAENCVMSFGDSHRSYDSHGPAHILYRTAAEYRNPYAQWLAREMQRRGIGRRAYCGWASLLWYDETLAAKPIAGLPTFWNSDDIGWITSRSSWDADAVLVGFKCGAMHGRKAQQYYDAHPGNLHEIGGGHGHADVNSFQLYARGQWLAIDPGYERPKWTRNHSTLLVNGHGQLGEGQTWFDRKAVLSAKAASRMVHAQHEAGFDYLVGDAMGIYPAEARLRKFHRHFLFLKPDVVVIVDDLAAEAASRFDWLLQAEARLEQRDPHAFFAPNGLAVQFLAPRSIRAAVSARTLTATPEAASECVIVTVLQARRAGEPFAAARLETAGGGRVTLTARRRRVEFTLAERRVTIGVL